MKNFLIIILLSASLSLGLRLNHQSEITTVSVLVIQNIPVYGSSFKAEFDETLPVGGLYLLDGEDQIKIKRNQL
jgi:hypothetical protein